MLAVAALVWCAFAVSWSYVHGARIPLLALVDLGFHELGHLVCYVFPVNDLLTAAAGSLFQVGVPVGLAAYFFVLRHDALGASVCCAWAATSARDVAVYVADAPYEQLPLLGGEHDWAYILGPEQLDRLDRAATYATFTRGLGILLALAATALALHTLLRSRTPASIARQPVPMRVLPSLENSTAATPRHPSESPDGSGDHEARIGGVGVAGDG
jgi:hypothetical protein